MANSSLATHSKPSGSGSAVTPQRASAAVTAFVGRTLRGPVNEPVRVASFSEFQRAFGGLWQPAMLPYAVEQYFENGGREAIVVRVSNGGRAPSVSLPTAAAPLRLRGVCPGTREYLRASVDYDDIEPTAEDQFNLVLQRLRVPGTELIEDQEIYRRVSVRASAQHYIVAALARSRLARVEGPVPSARPTRSVGSTRGALVGYVAAGPDGDDGDALSDYDLIGNERDRSGLFALHEATPFQLLCVPPLTREQDVGLPALTVALWLCRARHAMLVVDPPVSWSTPQIALARLPHWPLISEDALMYFPRVRTLDRLRGRPETFASCGAAAGLLARGDAGSVPSRLHSSAEESLLRPGLRPAALVRAPERAQLAQHGVNTLQAVRAPAGTGLPARTLMPDCAGDTDWRALSARRFALYVVARIEQLTAWSGREANAPRVWREVRAQTVAFLEALDAQGAFSGRTAEDSYFVICDQRLNDVQRLPAEPLRLVYGFAAARPGDFHAFLVTHTREASRTRPVTVNRLATGVHRLDEQIETAILRAVLPER